MSRPTISCAVIAKNEENNIRIWFESVKGLFDEYIFVDTGSTDKTVEIALELGLTVHHFTWINDFAAARNFAFSKATCEYIFWNDLDDVLSNKEDFISWRDSVLGICDYWLAAYHYAFNEEGIPVCTFVRERIIKNNGKFEWKYFIHEGIVPKAGTQPKLGYCRSWTVNHRRSKEDLVKDRGRNLKIFNQNLDKMDNRMKFYYGKEFYESGDPVTAIRWLKEAVSEIDLEAHDRLLATQYLIYSLMQTNQVDQAVSVALTGLQIFPDRAEFWVSIGDVFIKQGKFSEARPFFQAAKHCTYNDQLESKIAMPVFSTKEAYTFYPRNQIARVYAQLGKFEDALKEIRECMEYFPNPETETMKGEVEKIIELRPGSSAKRTKVDDIVISGVPGGPYEWDYEIYKERGIGGSETAAVEMAHWIHKLSGRPVKVFNNRSIGKKIEGVDYLPIAEAPHYFGRFLPYFHVAWRHNVKISDAPTWLWNHDLMTPGGEQPYYKRSLALSDFHKSFLHTMQGIPLEKIHVTRNGIDPERFKNFSGEKDPLVVWRSSPDRGLERAIRVMDKVRETLDLKLNVYYGFDNMYKNNAAKQANDLKKMIQERPWITLKGNVTQKQLSEECSRAMVWLYPTDFCETYCISAIESLCEGVYPVVRSYGALKDTLKEAHDKGMASLLEHDCESDEQMGKYVHEVIQAVTEKKWERVKVDPHQFSWESVAKEWLKAFEEDQ